MRPHLAAAVYLCLALAAAQEQPATEMSTRDEPATFKARVNLVLVPVVVRDKAGRAIGNLEKPDFQLFDKGKPQVITRFTVEQSGGKPAPAGVKPAGKNSDTTTPTALPDRFVAYLFDDIHLEFGDLARLRDAAGRHLQALQPADRAAIFTTSGQTVQDFTGDQDALHSTLLRINPHPISYRSNLECPDMGYYLADQIRNHDDPSALQAMIAETMACAHLDAASASAAESMVRAAASRVVGMGDQETRVTIGVLRDVIRRMATTPGQRILILASPGFLTPEHQQDKSEIMDRAIRSNVIISAIDARGLWVDPMLDASRPGTYTGDALRVRSQYERISANAQADVLAEFAAGTGGMFFQNSNDLDEGFRRVAAAPDYYYLLAFSPQNLKMDGSFHSLKVSLKNANGLSASARKGYYAPKHLSDKAETAKQEIREAIFSREELNELPIGLNSQFFKPSGETARVTVLAHVDLKNLRFRKADGRNYNNLTIVAALFDGNGNYVTGVQKLLEMRLKDETLVQRADSGITIRNTLDVKPGTYMVRLVVRDSEGEQMSAQNGAVDIP